MNVIGQEKLKIEIDNPQPRVGQNITFSINDDFLTEYFEKEFGKNVDLNSSSSLFGMRSDDFEKVIVFKKAKKYKIGPFNFEFNGTKYVTNVIEVEVLPELPMENGLWLRITEFEGEKQLILEQLIRNESNKSDTEDGGVSFTVGGVKPEGIEFANLNYALTEDIKLSNYSSSTYTITPEDADPHDAGFSYSIKKYKINSDNDFIGEYIITEDDFTNLPEKFDIGNIKIQK
jgi:hypothetical protein